MAATKASSIGWMFVPQYYTFVNKDPSKLHCFYTKKSTLIHGVEGEDCQPCYGQQEIHERIMSLGFEDCKVFVSTVDSQSSAENGIVVQVVGELSNKGGPWRKFAQTFFLAEQPNGYFVLNDIFRYIKEESDDEDSASNAGGAAATAEEATTSAPTAPADVLATLDQPIGQHAHHDFELASGHGAPGDAAGVTVVPPMDQQADSDARANLNELVNGHTSQEHVVELHDEINDEQPEQSGHAIAHQQTVENEAAAPEPEQAQPDAVEEPVQAAPVAAAEEPVSESEPQQVQESESAPLAFTSSPAPSTSAPASQASAPAPQAAAPAPSKPSAPKSWASLAATNTDKWKGQVVSETRGISSSKPGSKVNSGASTPAAAVAASRGPTPAVASASASASAAPAAPASEKGSNDGFITAGPRERKNNYNSNNNHVEHQQGESSSHDNARTRTPHFNNNVETGFSIVVTGVTQSIGHAMLRQHLSDEFAQVHGPNRRKEWAKLSYLDIDRSKETAYVDFEAEWAMKKAIEAGQANVDGTMLTITGGKGGRRDVSAAANRGQQHGGNPGRGGGGGGRGAAHQGQGRGGPQSGRGASNAQRGGGAGRTPSGRGQ